VRQTKDRRQKRPELEPQQYLLERWQAMVIEHWPMIKILTIRCCGACENKLQTFVVETNFAVALATG
jgi:hypothetical protein